MAKEFKHILEEIDDDQIWKKMFAQIQKKRKNEFIKNSGADIKFESADIPVLLSEKEKKCFNRLNINPDDIYDENIIKQSYRKLSAQYHPDNHQTGSREKFEEITEAKNYLLRNKD